MLSMMWLHAQPFSCNSSLLILAMGSRPYTEVEFFFTHIDLFYNNKFVHFIFAPKADNIFEYCNKSINIVGLHQRILNGSRPKRGQLEKFLEFSPCCICLVNILRWVSITIKSLVSQKEQATMILKRLTEKWPSNIILIKINHPTRRKNSSKLLKLTRLDEYYTLPYRF